ncbi:uncharacterized protein LOC134278762 [Saccostrea cucullata]|uniref:uncharacterized protein LOC134278762 n=1 Tax=Saccostrea cuccullata TaxID=36930 RepID=UPI002ED5E8D7
MTNVIHVTNATLYECHFATVGENEMHSWLNAFTESVKQYREGTSPVHTLLKRQNCRQPETVSSPHIIAREKSFIRSVSERSVRKNAKDDGKSVSKQNISQRCLLRLNSVNTEKEKIKAVFLELDKNGNGYLEEREFAMTLKEFGLDLSDSESKEIFRSIDADGDGKVAFNEFYDYFLEKILSEDKSALLKAFNEADREKKGAINFREFSEFVRDRHSTICLDKVLSTFDKLSKNDCSGELSFQDFQCMSILDDLDIFPDSTENFEALLKSRFDLTDPKNLRQKIENRWQKFASFRRQGANGSVVMKGANGIVEDVVPGEYNLKDLAKFVDLPKLLPKVTIVKGVSWESSNIPNTSGNLVFPSDFNGILEVEIATSELLGFYGCTFADSRAEKVSLPYRHAVQDFTYENNYLADYVEKQNGGAGLERHGFSHLDCPLDEISGYFILAKMIGDELHVSAFKIPKRHTLYIPENCIHSNDYLKGTWRTMLSDETNIDHVLLKRKNSNGEESCLQSFTFKFS